MRPTLLVLLIITIIGGGVFYWYTTQNEAAVVVPTPISTEPAPEPVATSPATYTGLSEAEAEVLATQNGVPFRVVERDGEPQMVTRDFRAGRINATVTQGVVSSYSVEGEVETNSKPEPAEAGAHDEIIGMTEAEATAYAAEQNLTIRIGLRDGESLPLTMDLRPGRITAEIEGGVITKYTIE